jgi:mono/diheme cytochrome c family protein
MTARWLILCALLLSGCRQQMAGMATDSGQAIYMNRCAVCHGDHGEGRAGMYPALASSEWVDGPPQRLAAIILDGMQGRLGNYDAVMPGWGAILRDTEIAAVMTWLRQGKSPVTSVDVNQVRIETAGRDAFWTVEDLKNMPVR